ncbi:hypothetical protein IC762_30370 [Bradyrhizobium genosp. L]|uniref:hypothetical protein n=1 Tax=Bradyrhizobium genosp. L TaxID=83637 RepID=UPI0018A25D8E|nr:hypothetical protein [Bradyrhizobium genosp. L]QPF83920.1 hypothetical protein IC762_30370 [Bradyrhizobium genosp. L]
MLEKFKENSLVEVVKRNGDFRKHYGIFVGALLYLRSVGAASSQSLFWNAAVAVITAVVAAALQKYGWRLGL